ncbi:phage holin family protein [Roseibacterium sp. SDUM158017]|uniref:phage holin family protein n=1 Tax=Roseicyclus salinarum TaxID=3036773 RepID=UPI002415828C|nr:phage holin family protein [Roseibacterium sp. SDUM158017]MDG4649760.1 phage holin family protein [Roseibacterium sp. SDUM158017]
MIEDLIGALVRSQFGDVKRRTAGAVLELAALGMAGLATAFVFVALHVWLAGRMETWLAALAVAGVALFVALILMLVGRSLLLRKARRQRNEALSGLEALSLLLRPAPGAEGPRAAEGDPAGVLVGAALAAGIMLGRSVGR